MTLLKKCLIRGFVVLCRVLWGIDRTKVVMTSFSGKSYSDNPRAVSEALHSLTPGAKIVWLFRQPEIKKAQCPAYIKCVSSAGTLRIYWELATAAVVLTNFAFPEIPKSGKQLFIQTWHGDKAFKKVLFDSGFASESDVVPEQREGFCDYAVAGSAYGEKQYRSAFRYKGKVLMCGTPRNDRLVNNCQETARQIRQSLGYEENEKILLFAPTFRRQYRKSNEHQKIAQIDLTKTLDCLEQISGEKWKCLLRAHPAAVGLCGVDADRRIADASGYEDMADLLLISDMLITDYSSCAGDFALTGRPVVLFQADRQEYLEKDRTFYFDIEDSPYFVAENQTELETILMEMTEEKAKENCQKILAFYGDCETGHAAQTVAQIIKDWIER